MSTYIRFLVSYAEPGAIPRDKMSNTLYYQWTGSGGPTGADALTQATAIGAAYTSSAYAQLAYRGFNFDIRAYDMAQPEPRPLLTQYSLTPLSTIPDGDREAAICLSYYAGRNLPSLRGRIYCGPIDKAYLGKTVATQLTADVVLLGTKLKAAGGAAWSWNVRSEKNNSYAPITNWWCDNAWDHVASRGFRATARTLGP